MLVVECPHSDELRIAFLTLSLALRLRSRRSRFGIEAGYSSWLILAMNTAPVSTSVRSPEFAADSIGSTDVSLCPFTVLAKGTMIPPGVEVIVGTQAPLEMP